MRGIVLKDSIKLFGFKHAFPFWFRWSFVDPIKMWVWLNITHKSYCNYSGYHCMKEECEHKHFTEKKDILAIWEKGKKEMERVESGKDGLCNYCGDEKGTETIPNPNSFEINQWLVCKTCDEVIKTQNELSFLSISRINNPKRVEELNDRLLEISNQTGKSIMNAQINKVEDGYKSSSVIFTGEK